MGNWRTVQVQGTIDAQEAQDAISLLRYRLGTNVDPQREYYCLSWCEPPSLVGLNQWIFADGTVTGHGNLAERDYSIATVEGTLRDLAQRFLSLNMVLHAGGENEDPTCVATLWVRDGHVALLPPQVPTVHGKSEAEMVANLLKNLTRQP